MIVRKTNTGLARTITAYGPWMNMDIEKMILHYNIENSTFSKADNQTHYGYKGYMKIKITAINSGSSDAYQTSYKYIFSKYVKLLNFGDILDKKNILQLAKNESSGDTIVKFNSNRQVPQNTKDAYNIYIKYDFGEEASDSSIIKRNLDSENNKDRVILKSADVTLCQNAECNDDDSFVNQFIDINFKMSMANIISVTPEPDIEPININPNIEPENLKPDIEPEKNTEELDQNPDEVKLESKSKSWIAIPIVICVVIIAFIIFLIIDFKKKICLFKNKPTKYISPIEETRNVEKIEKIEVSKATTDSPKSPRRRSLKNYQFSNFVSLSMKTNN